MTTSERCAHYTGKSWQACTGPSSTTAGRTGCRSCGCWSHESGASDTALHATLAQIASDAGFSRIFDATDAYDGARASELAIGPNDFHPNIHGHARISHAARQRFCRVA